MSEPVRYKYLQPKRGSRYQQLAVNGRIRAEILYRETVGPEPLSPEEVAREYDLPLEAVQEAIHYCEHNQELLDAERAREQATIEARGLDRWPHAPQVPEPTDESLPRRQQRETPARELAAPGGPSGSPTD